MTTKIQLKKSATSTSKKSAVKSIQRILLSKEGKTFYLKDLSQDYHCQYGMIKKADLKKSSITTNKGKHLSAFNPSFIDTYQKIKRGPQIIPRKDIGIIIAETGINKTSVVVDAGSGSAALCTMLASIAKKVTSYELREDFHNIAKHNKALLGLKNLTLKNKSIHDGIDEKNVDVITLDLPDPWNAIKHAAKALKSGGFLVSYSPTIPQVSDFVETITNKHSDDFIFLKTIEISQREWEINNRKIRPKSQEIGHSGFITYIRRI